jgi:hypothetical protein
LRDCENWAEEENDERKIKDLFECGFQSALLGKKAY